MARPLFFFLCGVENVYLLFFLPHTKRKSSCLAMQDYNYMYGSITCKQNDKYANKVICP